MQQAWSVVLTATFLASLILLGKHNPWGWILGIADELLWIAYAITTRQWAFIISALIYTAICAHNLRTWRAAPASRPHTLPRRPPRSSRRNRR